MTYSKKSGHPTQPGNRSAASRPKKRKRKRKHILYRAASFFNSLNWLEKTTIVLYVLAACFMLRCVLGGYWIVPVNRADAQPEQAQEEAQEYAPQEYIFKDGEGHPLDVHAMAGAWAAEAGREKRYDLTDAERWEVASAVTAEAAGEPFAGKVAVAQCVLQSCEDDGIRPNEVLVRYSYAKARPTPTAEALEAVHAVFDLGHVATTEPIKYFYAPAICSSSFHESQIYVMTINGHRFFAEAKQ